MSKQNRSSLFIFILLIVLIVLLSLFGPEEKSLGANVRIVYLHGAWVLAAEIAFIAAGIAGALALISRATPALTRYRSFLDGWSAALGRAGIVFWVTYLPLSMLAMQSNWNGLFLAEPRFRLALTFAVVGLLMQAGLWLLGTAWLTSAGNLVFIIALRVVFASATNIMHPPPSPIFSSGLWQIIAFFVALNIFSWLAAFFLAKWFSEIDVRKI